MLCLHSLQLEMYIANAVQLTVKEAKGLNVAARNGH